MENNLPKGWVECKFGDVAFIHNGYAFATRDFRKDKGIPLIKQSQLDGDKVDLSKCVFLEEHFLKTKKDFVLKKGDVLIGMSGSIGKLCVYDLDSPALQNQRTGKVVSYGNFIDKRFFWYFLSTIERTLLDIGKGMGVTNVSADDIESLVFNLPPLPEQHRIVAKLDALFEKMETNKQRLEKIPKILKRFRQSVLAAAVSGKLTEEWRKTKRIFVEWEYLKATDACETVASGSTPKGKPFFEKEEIPYLKVYNIVNQNIDFSYKPQYIKREIHEKELKRCKVYPNDVIINIVGPPLGKVALMPNSFPEWNINQAIVVFRPKDFLLPKFLYYVLCDGEQIKAIELELRGTAGQSNISLSQCRNFNFPIPPHDEQTEIVRRVEQLFAFADKIEARYTKAKAMLDKLPQSILAKAFRGELVAQDPNDEPASVLLERIKVEKEKLTAEKKPIRQAQGKGKNTKGYSIEETLVKIAAEKKVKYSKRN